MDEVSRGTRIYRSLRATGYSLARSSWWRSLSLGDQAWLCRWVAVFLLLFIEIPTPVADIRWLAALVSLIEHPVGVVAGACALAGGALLLERIFQRRCQAEERLRGWVHSLRFLSSALPLLGLLSLAFWPWLDRRAPGWAFRQASLRSSMPGMRPRGGLMRGGFRPARRIAVWFLGALERSWAGAAWLVTSHALLSLGGVLWVVSKTGEGSLGAWAWWLVVSGLHGLGLLSEVLIVIEPPSYSVERARPFWGWTLLWLMPVYGLLPIVLWRYRQLSGGARERSLVAQAYRFQGAVEARHDWRILAAKLRAGWSRVAFREQWRRPLGLGRRSQLGDLDLRVGRAARWKAAQLLVDGALLVVLVLPDQVVDESRARDLSRSLLQAFWLYLGWLLVLMALKLGHVLAVWSDRQGGLRWLDDKPSLRLAALGSAALWLGMLSAAAVRIDGVEAGILILAYGSALAMIGTWVTISLLAPMLPAVARDPEDRWFWPLTFGVVLTLAAGAALVARHNPSLVLSALDPLILLGLSLLSATWLRWRHQLPPCHRPWLWIILTMAPGGGLTASLWPGWKVRGDQRGP